MHGSQCLFSSPFLPPQLLPSPCNKFSLMLATLPGKTLHATHVEPCFDAACKNMSCVELEFVVFDIDAHCWFFRFLQHGFVSFAYDRTDGALVISWSRSLKKANKRLGPMIRAADSHGGVTRSLCTATGQNVFPNSRMEAQRTKVQSRAVDFSKKGDSQGLNYNSLRACYSTASPSYEKDVQSIVSNHQHRWAMQNVSCIKCPSWPQHGGGDC